MTSLFKSKKKSGLILKRKSGLALGPRLGLTLIELILTLGMFVILISIVLYVYHIFLFCWFSTDQRAGINIELERGVRFMVEDLREAKEIKIEPDFNEIRFTTNETTYYIYYLYNPNEPYIQPPLFGQNVYELRKAVLTGGLDGMFNYGQGRIIMTDIISPQTSQLSINNKLITFDLTISRNNETMRFLTKVRPRNL